MTSAPRVLPVVSGPSLLVSRGLRVSSRFIGSPCMHTVLADETSTAGICPLLSGFMEPSKTPKVRKEIGGLVR